MINLHHGDNVVDRPRAMGVLLPPESLSTLEAAEKVLKDATNEVLPPLSSRIPQSSEKEFFIDNLLVRTPFILEIEYSLF